MQKQIQDEEQEQKVKVDRHKKACMKQFEENKKMKDI